MVMKMSVENITPEIAREYLKTNTNNYRKKMNRTVVAGYADDMRNGRWELNGEPICFGRDGQLKNGQHRLAAVILAGKPVRMAVIRGVADNVTVYDMPLRRTVYQAMQHRDVDCNCTVAAAARILVNRFKKGFGDGKVIDFLDRNIAELNRAYRIACYGSESYSKNAPCVAGCYLMLQSELIASYEAELFFRLFNDKGLTRCDGYDPSPALTARKMFDDRAKIRGGYQIQKERLEIIVLAMRDFGCGVARKEPYKLGEPFFYNELMDETERED